MTIGLLQRPSMLRPCGSVLCTPELLLYILHTHVGSFWVLRINSIATKSHLQGRG